MSYISAEMVEGGKEVIIWERDEEGNRSTKYVPVPFYFYIRDEDGEHRSIHGDKLTRLDFDSKKDYYATRNDLESNGVELFESDVSATHKVLSDLYYNKPAPTLNITFLDIEVDYSKEIGFASIDNPYAPINSVALHHQWNDKIVVYAIPPKDGKWIESNGDDIDVDDFRAKIEAIVPIASPYEITFFKTEKDLLLYLLEEIQNSDVVCGWNSDFFDMPYIAKRIEKVLGRSFFRKLSFPGGRLPKYRDVEMFGNTNTTIDLSGRISCDYLLLFKKYEMGGRPTYKLESVAEDIVPDLPKLEYEGSLHDLYRKDFPMFVRYNIRDTEILNGFEEKLGYVALANDMYHISTALFQNVTGTLKLAELATINYCHHELGLVVPNNKEATTHGSIQGALVTIPQVGMHDWIGSIDISSLYPSSIRSINISPETLIGQFPNNVRAAEAIAKGEMVNLTFEYENGETEEMSADEWRDVLKENKWAISGYGTVFDQNKKGIIPAILEDWYATRKQYQKKMRKAISEHNDIDKAYFDRLQYVYKIKLNSFYGALNNEHFRFYDLRMGESTTGTGRAILRHQCAKVVELLDGEYVLPIKNDNGEGYTNEYSAIYSDTDSVYFKTHAQNKTDAILIADTVAERVNDSFQEFMQETFLCNPGFDNIIKAGREVVARRGIFVDKKRYILNVVDNEGEEVDKLKVMGLDTKKTTLPKEISKVLNNFVGKLLRGEDWDTIANEIVDYKDTLYNTTNVMSIGLPKGVQKVEDYTNQLKIYGNGVRLPGHVAASIFYNQCLETYNDKESMPIVSGMKIKVFYLTEKYDRFKSIAIPTDCEFVPEWFLENFTIDRDAHIQRLVDKPLGNIIKAIGKSTPSKQSLVVESLLDF